MSKVLQELVQALELERLDDNLFRGATPGRGTRLFGGLVLGQATSASQQTVPESLQLHSMHAYFMRKGDPYRPVIYDVEAIRDGRSVVSRRVVARQHGAAIFSCQLSYQIPEAGFEHQEPMPATPPPDDLPSDEERWAAMPRDADLPEREWPIDYRQTAPVDVLAPQPLPPVTSIWIRAAGPLPDSPALHQQLFAFASDVHILATSLRPHGISLQFNRELQAATIDHAVWFHRPLRMDRWLLYHIHSPSASNARGLSIGHVYEPNGTLVATVAQEGLIRMRRREA